MTGNLPRSQNPLQKSNAHFATPKGANFSERLEKYSEWTHERLSGGYWPYARTLASPPLPVAEIAYSGKEPRSGINLAIQDYLGLSTHDAIKEAAIRAVRDFGVHSAGSAMLLGNNPISLRLEASISRLTGMEHVLLFPTGWSAGYGVVKGLVREYDHIVLDQLSHACLQDGTAAATKNIYRYKHLDAAAVRNILHQIRATDTENGVLVIAEGLFSMDSDSPDLVKLRNACEEFNAMLLVDVAHDLGCLGQNGAGQIGIQNVVGDIGLVMGAFSKTFASNGGFIATNDHKIKQYLQFFANPHTFSNALSPIQCAVAE